MACVDVVPLLAGRLLLVQPPRPERRELDVHLASGRAKPLVEAAGRDHDASPPEKPIVAGPRSSNGPRNDGSTADERPRQDSNLRATD